MEVEITLNNKPLSYIEDDIQMPILTPSTMIYGIAISEVEEGVSSMEQNDLRKRARHIQKSKNLAR